MLFSKSFGYAVRAVLYIASMQNGKRQVQLDEITSNLHLPKQFIARILKTLVKEKVLTSVKGPNGGFSITKEALQFSLLRILEVTDGNNLDNCVLKKKDCSEDNPCPVHDQFTNIRQEIKQVMLGTTIAELVKGKHADFIKSLSEVNGNGKRKK